MPLLWQEGIGAQSKGGKKHKTYHKKRLINPAHQGAYAP